MFAFALQGLIQSIGRLAGRQICQFAGCGVILALTMAAMPQPAAADTVVWSSETEDGGYLLVISADDEDMWYYFLFDAEDNLVQIGWAPPGNPSPDGSEEPPGDLSSRVALLKQKGGGGLAGPTVEQTPLGKHLAGKGKGIGPLHNPSDDSTPGGQSPSSIEFTSPQKEFEEFWAGAGYPHGPGFDGNGGSIGGQIGNALKQGKKGAGHGDGDGAKPSDGGLWDDAMPGPPELVNPAWRTKSTTATGPRGMGRLNLGSSIRSKQIGGAVHLRIDPSPKPEKGAGLFPQTLPKGWKPKGSSKTFQAGFVLVPPTTQGARPRAMKTSSQGLDPQPIPWASFGGARGGAALQQPGTLQRPGGAPLRGPR